MNRGCSGRWLVRIVCGLALALVARGTAVGAPGAAEGTTPEAAAAVIRDLGGQTRGVCVFVGCPEPELPIAVVRATEFLVYVQSPDANEVAAVQEAAETAGLLGVRLFAERGTAERIHLASNLADGLVASKGPEGKVPEAEALRVLRPGAAAVLAGKTVTKPPAVGTDSWSHPYHGPDNNPQSADQVARAPYLTQFLARPLFSSQPEVTVAAGGRVFKAFGHMAFRDYQNHAINTLTALSAYNGAVLWQRPLKPGFMIHRNTMIATPEVLYLADDESCKLLDAATGEVKGEIVPPKDVAGGSVWKWMALQDGMLLALLGGPEVKAPVKRGAARGLGGWPWGMWPGYDYGTPETAWGYGRTFLAIDLTEANPPPPSVGEGKGGGDRALGSTRTPTPTLPHKGGGRFRVRWSHREEDLVDSRGVCMRNGRIYFYCPQRSLGCLDAGTGEIIWRTADADLLKAIGPHGRAQTATIGFSTSTYVKCNDRSVFFAGPQRPRLVVVSAKDGSLVWQRDDGNLQLVLRDDAIYAAGRQGTKGYRLDYDTGNVLATFVGRRACTRATGSVDSIFFRAAEGTVRYLPATNTVEHLAPMRPACHDGVVIAAGHLYWGPWICGCNLSLFGVICLGPADEADLAPPAGETVRLEAPAGPEVIEPVAHPGDWPAYRADAARSTTSGATVPEAARLMWTAAPLAPVVATAPVALDGLAFVAGTDGIVRALDAADGTPRWKAVTGGAVYFPPTVWGGRAYVGSNDGHVYAFEAATGRLLWRFRAAPVDRKIPVYGTLASTWPVAGGVAVEDGVVYAAAGIAHYDGTHVYALDARTGGVKWHNGSSGALDPALKNGVSLQGPVRLAGGRVEFAGGNVCPVASYDARTGRCLIPPPGRIATPARTFFHPRDAWSFLLDDIKSAEFRARDGAIEVRPNRIAFQPADAASNAAWQVKPPLDSCRAAALTANALIVAGPSGARDRAAWTVAALRIRDAATLWSHPLPAAPVSWGVAVDRAGRTFVALEDGRVVCFGK